MILDAVVLFRGLDAKSRLGTHRGGPLPKAIRQKLVVALLNDVVREIGASNAFAQVHVGVAEGQAARSVSELGFETLALKGQDVNEQIRFASDHKAQRCDGYLLIAADLPLLSQDYLKTLVRELQRLKEKEGLGVVFGLSRKLGAASVVLSPPNVAQIVLGAGHTFLTNRTRLKRAGVPYVAVLALEGYLDLDTPQDLYEVVVLHAENVLARAENFKNWLTEYGSMVEAWMKRKKAE